jgi:hypothetical protein
MRFRYISILGIICLVCVISVQADIRDVSPGGTVFIGEEKLDISAAGIRPGSQIAWWAPGTSLEETPAETVTVSDPASFSALSSSFSGKEGIWYSLAEKTPVIKIKQPRLNLRVSDTTSDFEATGKWLPRGHLASFQIDTNLHELCSRTGVTGAPVDINIQSPGGARYSAVSGPAGFFSLTGIPVRSSMYDTGAVWDTGGTDSGTYSMYAECTANRMNSNNPDPGAAVSQTITVLIQDVNPLIKEAEKREKEEVSDNVTPAATLPVVPTASPASTPGKMTVEPSPSVSPGTGPEQQSSPVLSPVITEIPSPSVLPPAPVSPSPVKTPSVPLPGIIAILALIYIGIKR